MHVSISVISDGKVKVPAPSVICSMLVEEAHNEVSHYG